MTKTKIRDQNWPHLEIQRNISNFELVIIVLKQYNLEDYLYFCKNINVTFTP